MLRRNSSRHRTVGVRAIAKRGVAAVELAVCLPVIVLLAFATVDACGMLYLGQSLKITSFEGARVGVVPKAETSNVRFQCETLLGDRGINDYTIEMDPASPASLNEGDYFRVTVSASYSANSFMGSIYGDKVVTRSTALRAN